MDVEKAPPGDWAKQIVSMEDGFKDEYIWFSAESSQKKDRVRGAVGRLEDLAELCSEKTLTRLEKERDDALDAVEIVSREMVAALAERDRRLADLTNGPVSRQRALGELARLRAECESLRRDRDSLQDHLRSTASLPRLSEVQVAKQFFNDDDDESIPASAAAQDEEGRRHRASRRGWPPRRIASPRRGGVVTARIYSDETKDFDAVRLSCRQLEAESCRRVALQQQTPASQTKNLKALAASGII